MNIFDLLDKSKPLTAYTRGDNNNCIEAIHRGFITIIEDDGNILYELGKIHIFKM